MIACSFIYININLSIWQRSIFWQKEIRICHCLKNREEISRFCSMNEYIVSCHRKNAKYLNCPACFQVVCMRVEAEMWWWCEGVGG